MNKLIQKIHDNNLIICNLVTKNNKRKARFFSLILAFIFIFPLLVFVFNLMYLDTINNFLELFICIAVALGLVLSEIFNIILLRNYHDELKEINYWPNILGYFISYILSFAILGVIILLLEDLIC